MPDKKFQLLTTPAWQDYCLLDSGHGRKLERFGDYTLIRPEAEAIWDPGQPESEWMNANAEFKSSGKHNKSHWAFRQKTPDQWNIQYRHLKLSIRLSQSRHIGVFPEQGAYWDWIEAFAGSSGREIKVLNLFGYTGVSSIAAARGGAYVTHVDASKRAVKWGQQNQKLSGLSDTPIRWLIDDVQKFVSREIRRGSVYDGIILDPPKFGHGPKGETWDFYSFFPELLTSMKQIISDRPRFIALTVYAVKASSLTLHQTLSEIMQPHKGSTESGELGIEEVSGRILPTSVFARWAADD